MLRAIVAVLLILWLLGFVLHLAGGIIHILAVIAVALPALSYAMLSFIWVLALIHGAIRRGMLG